MSTPAIILTGLTPDEFRALVREEVRTALQEQSETQRLVPTTEVARLAGYKTAEGFLSMAQRIPKVMALAQRGPWKGFRWDPEAVLAALKGQSRERTRRSQQLTDRR